MKLQIIGRLNKKDKINSNHIKSIIANSLYIHEPLYKTESSANQPFQISIFNTENHEADIDEKTQYLRDFFDKFYTVCQVKYEPTDSRKVQSINRKLYSNLQSAKTSQRNNDVTKHPPNNKQKTNKARAHFQIDLKQGLGRSSVHTKIRKVSSLVTINLQTDIRNNKSQKGNTPNLNKSFHKKAEKQSLRNSKRSQFNKENVDSNLKPNLSKISRIKDGVEQIRFQLSQLAKMCKLKKK